MHILCGIRIRCKWSYNAARGDVENAAGDMLTEELNEDFISIKWGEGCNEKDDESQKSHWKKILH